MELLRRRLSAHLNGQFAENGISYLFDQDGSNFRDGIRETCLDHRWDSKCGLCGHGFCDICRGKGTRREFIYSHNKVCYLCRGDPSRGPANSSGGISNEKTICVREQRLNSLEADIHAREERLLALNGDIANRENRLSSLEGDVHTHEQRLSDLKQDVTAYEQRICAGNEELRLVSEKLTQLRLETDNLENKSHGLRGQIKSMKNRFQMVKNRETSLQSVEETLQKREEFLHQREKSLQEREESLKSQEAVLQKNKADLQERERVLKDKEWDEHIVIKDEQLRLFTQECELQDRLKEHEASAATLDLWMASLDVREKALDEREEGIQTIERSLAERVLSLNKLEAGFREAETHVKTREDAVENQLNALKSTEQILLQEQHTLKTQYADAMKVVSDLRLVLEKKESDMIVRENDLQSRTVALFNKEYHVEQIRKELDDMRCVIPVEDGDTVGDSETVDSGFDDLLIDEHFVRDSDSNFGAKNTAVEGSEVFGSDPGLDYIAKASEKDCLRKPTNNDDLLSGSFLIRSDL